MPSLFDLEASILHGPKEVGKHTSIIATIIGDRRDWI